MRSSLALRYEYMFILTSVFPTHTVPERLSSSSASAVPTPLRLSPSLWVALAHKGERLGNFHVVIDQGDRVRLRADVLWSAGRLNVFETLKIARRSLIKWMHTYCCQYLTKHAGHKDTTWHGMKRENINLSGKQISSGARIRNVPHTCWLTGSSRCGAERGRGALCDRWLGHVHNNRSFWCPSSLPEMLRWLSLQLKPSVHQRLSAPCGPYVWVLIERGLLCLGHR